MAVEFFSAKNACESARANGVLLHSSYNPQAEAERFAHSLEAAFIPSRVIILEGALSYALPYLRQKFKGAKIGCARYCDDFLKSDSLWDFCIPLNDKKNGVPFSERLFSFLGEEELFQCVFYEWPPSARAWPKESKEAWKEIKAAMEKAKTLLATREYFSKRWLKNKILFFEKLRKTCALKKTSLPVLICASGPSLESAAPSIRNVRKKLFVCALSSSISALKRLGIEPDLCLSTDGGHWAKKHLETLKKIFLKSPLALASEGACPSALFKEKSILPICYDDDTLSIKLAKAMGITFVSGRRNGTVSGSALELFLQNSFGPIFFAGLDLQNSKSGGHARPNALDAMNEEKDFRLSPKEKRAAAASFKNPSLEIYADWFSSFGLGERKVYRIAGRKKFERTLGMIKDISEKEFESLLEKEKEISAKDKFIFECGGPSIPLEKRTAAIKKTLEEEQKDLSLAKEIFPADCIMAKREKNEEEKARCFRLIEEKTKNLLQDIFKERA